MCIDFIFSKHTCLSTLHTRPSMLMPSRESPSGCSLSLGFLSTGICPFPRIWSTLTRTHPHKHTNTPTQTSVITIENNHRISGTQALFQVIPSWARNLEQQQDVKIRVSKTRNTQHDFSQIGSQIQQIQSMKNASFKVNSFVHWWLFFHLFPFRLYKHKHRRRRHISSCFQMFEKHFAVLQTTPENHRLNQVTHLVFHTRITRD